MTGGQTAVKFAQEAVRLFGYVAAVHSERFLPHVSKVVGNILRRFKDPESSVLEACAETLGVIAQQTASLVRICGRHLSSSVAAVSAHAAPLHCTSKTGRLSQPWGVLTRGRPTKTACLDMIQ